MAVGRAEGYGESGMHNAIKGPVFLGVLKAGSKILAGGYRNYLVLLPVREERTADKSTRTREEYSQLSTFG